MNYNKQKILTLIDSYRYEILYEYNKNYLSFPAESEDYIFKDSTPHWSGLSYLFWMCDNVEICINKNRWHDVSRWLGYIEGAMWFAGLPIRKTFPVKYKTSHDSFVDIKLEYGKEFLDLHEE